MGIGISFLTIKRQHLVDEFEIIEREKKNSQEFQFLGRDFSPSQRSLVNFSGTLAYNCVEKEEETNRR